MFQKKLEIGEYLRMFEAMRVPEWRLWIAAVLVGLGVRAVPGPSEELGIISISSVFAVILLMAAYMVSRPLWRALEFLKEGRHRNMATILSESVGPKEANALMVGLAQAMQEADERQVENRRFIKTTACANTRLVYQQNDKRFSDEFKALQERFYNLLRALVAEGYPFDPNAKYTDFLFVEEEKALSKRETPPPAPSPEGGHPNGCPGCM